MRTLLFLSLIAVLGCRSVPAPVIVTETVEGGKLTMEIVQETGSRGDVPVGEKASNVVSATTFSHAGGFKAKVTVTRSNWKPFAAPRVYFNCIDCHAESPRGLGLTVEQPKDPWFQWPMISLIVGGIALLFWFWGKVKAFLGPFVAFFRGKAGW